MVFRPLLQGYRPSQAISVGLFVQSSFGAETIYGLFSSNLHALRNVYQE
jgi:hypothetical protein